MPLSQTAHGHYFPTCRYLPIFVFTKWPLVNILPPSGKTMNWVEKWFPPLRVGMTSSTTMQSLGRSNDARQCRRENMVFVFFCHSPSPAHCLFEQVFEQVLRHSLWVNFDAVFNIFEKWLSFQVHYIVLIFVAKWRHNFHKIVVENCKNVQNLRKSFCAP